MLRPLFVGIVCISVRFVPIVALSAANRGSIGAFILPGGRRCPPSPAQTGWGDRRWGTCTDRLTGGGPVVGVEGGGGMCADRLTGGGPVVGVEGGRSLDTVRELPPATPVPPPLPAAPQSDRSDGARRRSRARSRSRRDMKGVERSRPVRTEDRTGGGRAVDTWSESEVQLTAGGGEARFGEC